jgi:Family of unknown function (DUF6252)
MRRIVSLVLSIVAATASCSSGDSTTTNGNDTPALSAKFDGTLWTATSITGTFAGGNLTVTGTAPALGTFTFSLIANAPGTYSISALSPVTTTYTLLSSTWSASGTNGSGTVNITSFGTNSASGTFNFIIQPVTSTAATGFKTLSEGKFTVKF